MKKLVYFSLTFFGLINCCLCQNTISQQSISLEKNQIAREFLEKNLCLKLNVKIKQAENQEVQISFTEDENDYISIEQISKSFLQSCQLTKNDKGETFNYNSYDLSDNTIQYLYENLKNPSPRILSFLVFDDLKQNGNLYINGMLWNAPLFSIDNSDFVEEHLQYIKNIETEIFETNDSSEEILKSFYFNAFCGIPNREIENDVIQNQVIHKPQEKQDSSFSNIQMIGAEVGYEQLPPHHKEEVKVVDQLADGSLVAWSKKTWIKKYGEDEWTAFGTSLDPQILDKNGDSNLSIENENIIAHFRNLWLYNNLLKKFEIFKRSNRSSFHDSYIFKNEVYTLDDTWLMKLNLKGKIVDSVLHKFEKHIIGKPKIISVNEGGVFVSHGRMLHFNQLKHFTTNLELLKSDTLNYSLYDNAQFQNGRLFLKNKYSDDLGTTWNRYSFDSDTHFSSLYFCASNSGQVLFAGKYKCYYSTDHGNTFSEMNLPIVPFQTNFISFFDDEITLGSDHIGDRKVFTTNNLGKSWEEIPTKIGLTKGRIQLNSKNVLFAQNRYFKLPLEKDWKSFKSNIIGYNSDYEYQGIRILEPIENGNMLGLGPVKSYFWNNRKYEWKELDVFLGFSKIYSKENIVSVVELTHHYVSGKVFISKNYGQTWKEKTLSCLKRKDQFSTKAFFPNGDLILSNKNGLFVLKIDEDSIKPFTIREEIDTEELLLINSKGEIFIVQTRHIRGRHGSPILYQLNNLGEVIYKKVLTEIDFNERNFFLDIHDNIVVHNSEKILLTKDLGNSWLDLSPKLNLHCNISNVVIGHDKNVYIGTAGMGVLKSNFSID